MHAVLLFDGQWCCSQLGFIQSLEGLGERMELNSQEVGAVGHCFSCLKLQVRNADHFSTA